MRFCNTDLPLPRCANQENMGATNSLTWVIQNSKVAAIIGNISLKLDDWRRDIYPFKVITLNDTSFLDSGTLSIVVPQRQKHIYIYIFIYWLTVILKSVAKRRIITFFFLVLFVELVSTVVPIT